MLWILSGLIFTIPRRVRVVSVAVAVLNYAVFPVDDQLHFFAPSLIPTVIDGVFFPLVDRAGALATFFNRRPSLGVWHYMDIAFFAHFVASQSKKSSETLKLDLSLRA
jgi:hypothetical protein